MSKNLTESVWARITLATKNKLINIAKKRKWTLSKVVCEILEKELNKKEINNDKE
jgi:hypothetical protein